MPQASKYALAIAVSLAMFASGCGFSSAGPTLRKAAPPPVPPTAALLPVSLPVGVEGAVAVGMEGKVYLFGGLAGWESRKTIESFDPSTGALSQAGALPVPLHDAAAALVGKTIYIFGGGSSGGPEDGIYAYQAGSNASLVGHLPQPIADAAAVAYGGAVYLCGGYNGVSPNPVVYRFEPNTGKITVAGYLPEGRRYAATVLSGGNIYLFGGLGTNGSRQEIYAFSLRRDVGKSAGTLPQPMQYAAAVTKDGRIYVVGGTVGGKPVADIWRFRPGRKGTGSLVRVGRLPSSWADGGVASSGGDWYLFGGKGLLSTKIIRLH